MLALGDNLCLDAVSRPEAFARLWPKLRAGYLLDALDQLDQPAAMTMAVSDYITSLSTAGITRCPSVGRGEDVRVHCAQLLGSGLDLDGELLQLSAFTRGGSARRPDGSDQQAESPEGVMNLPLSPDGV